jgi:phospholipid/cholesterol/gamma-HCH transport system substrate-binding protein
MAQLNAIAAQQSIELSRTTAALRRTVSAIDSASIDSTVNNLQTASANMAALTSDLRQTNVALNGLLSKLDRGEGTAGKLLTDTLLYRDVRSLVTRLDSLTTDFQKHPKKYVNLSIF